jgi:hypothetical protein
MIIARTGETLIVSDSGTKTTIVLTDDTKVRDKKGVLGIRKKQFSAAVLIPGLKVSVDGTADDQGRVVGVECLRMELGPPDETGRQRPVPVPGSEFLIEADTVIPALGNKPNRLIANTTPDIKM